MLINIVNGYIRGIAVRVDGNVGVFFTGESLKYKCVSANELLNLYLIDGSGVYRDGNGRIFVDTSRYPSGNGTNGSDKSTYLDGSLMRIGNASVSHYQDGALMRVGEVDFVYYSDGKPMRVGNDDFAYYSDGKLMRVGNTDFVYVICGHGVLQEQLLCLTKQCGLSDNVMFLGYRQDIRELLYASDLFIFPSKQEGMPVALMEAIAAGVPAKASNIRGNRELLKLQEEKKENADVLECLDIHNIEKKIKEIYQRTLNDDTSTSNSF